jgi:hypothetical protein
MNKVLNHTITDKYNKEALYKSDKRFWWAKTPEDFTNPELGPEDADDGWYWGDFEEDHNNISLKLKISNMAVGEILFGFISDFEKQPKYIKRLK